VCVVELFWWEFEAGTGTDNNFSRRRHRASTVTGEAPPPLYPARRGVSCGWVGGRRRPPCPSATTKMSYKLTGFTHKLSGAGLASAYSSPQVTPGGVTWDHVQGFISWSLPHRTGTFYWNQIMSPSRAVVTFKFLIKIRSDKILCQVA